MTHEGEVFVARPDELGEEEEQSGGSGYEPEDPFGSDEEPPEEV